MFTRILVPLDGSAQAERALPVAARLARQRNGTLILVRVAQPLGVETGLLFEHRDQLMAYLAQLAQQTGLAEIKHEEVAFVGYPAEMILDTIRAHRADIVILSSHGRTGLLRWALGSVAQRIVHHASVPVLVLPPQGLTLEASHPLRALIPLDGSNLAEAALEPAAVLVSALAPQAQGGGGMHLVEVVPFPSITSEADTTPSEQVRARDTAHEEARAYLYRTAEHLRREPFVPPSVQITWHVLADADVAGALVQLAQSGAPVQGAEGGSRFGLIAMATHGRGGLQRWVMGSITERVLAASKLPLLVIRPKEGEAIN